MWCWATAVASFTEYYTSTGPRQCRGLECQIDHKQCGSDGAYPGMIVEAATHFTGKQHKDYAGPMPQAELDAVLQAGKPVMMLVGPGQQSTHVVWLR
eukprot:gene19857-26897_t